MRVVLNNIKEWKNSKKKYNKYCKNLCKEEKWKRNEVFLKLFNLKSIKKCKEIIKKEFKEEEIKERGMAYYLFCDIFKIEGIKEDNKRYFLKWEKNRNPSIKELKKIMKENNYKEIELKAGGFYYMPRRIIARII